MLLQGDQQYFVNVELDSNIYCLIKRTADGAAEKK